MRVLLVNPPTGFSYRTLGIMRPPLGLAYIASVIRDRHTVEIVDFCVAKCRWQDFRYDDYDVIGISVDTARADAAFKIAAVAKCQGCTVVMGGLHVSFLDEDALRTGVVDYVVRNEGEYSFLSLLDFLSGRIPFKEVRGVSYCENGWFNRTPDAPFIADLDSLPLPARDLLPLDLYRERMNGRLMTTMITSRGCPFNCDFCSSSEFFGVRWRARSVENMLEEVGLLHREFGYKALAFIDDNFTLDPNRARALSEMFLEKGWDLTWSALTRVDTIVRNPDMVRTMARAGFSWTFIGFETGNQDSLNVYGKQATVRDSFKAMEILRENGVEVVGAFILGAVHETEEMMWETIDFAKRLNPRRAQFSMLTPYPGTKLFQDVKERLLTRDWSLYSGMHPTIELDHVTPKGLRHMHISAYASFYGRPRKAKENLSYILRISGGLIKHFSLKLFTWPRKPILHTAIFAKKCIARARWLVG